MSKASCFISTFDQILWKKPLYQACQTEARRADPATELASINRSEFSFMLVVLQEKIPLEDCQRSVEYPTSLII